MSRACVRAFVFGPKVRTIRTPKSSMDVSVLDADMLVTTFSLFASKLIVSSSRPSMVKM